MCSSLACFPIYFLNSPNNAPFDSAESYMYIASIRYGLGNRCLIETPGTAEPGAAAKRSSVVCALSGRAWGFNNMNVRAILDLLDINGEKRPEKIKDYFIVNNSILFEINVIFI